jgi:hypothetical protein
MTRDDIIRMALEQGLPETEVEGVFMVNSDDLGRMLAAEREACAKVAKETVCDMHLGTGIKIYGTKAAAAIRARGQA